MRRPGRSPGRRWATSPNVDVRVLLNPASAGGAALRRWKRIEPAARRQFPHLEVHQSAHAADLRRLAAEVATGDGLILAAGGDGTSHEVVNGLFANETRPTAHLGWLPLGSGNDIARAHLISLDPARALAGYRAVAPVRVDVGRVRHRSRDGTQITRYFGNSFTIGISAKVLELVLEHGKPLGGPVSYFLAALTSIGRLAPMAATIDGQDGHYTLIAVSNGPSVGAGMRISPAARVNDGQLDLVTVQGLSRMAAGFLLPRAYWGGHLRHPAVSHRLITTVTIDGDGPISYEADGELCVGVPPFQVTVLPHALSVARPATTDPRG